ncbi:potassium transporter Kup [Benzoatithermus flavus]|uniref:Probable potassium transport system protein Kup n=1 Tax=Benzoatithermus flavus TaxID=3108223 RepID=A0ABU8XN52_9PROT
MTTSITPAAEAAVSPEPDRRTRSRQALVLGALGIVFGDIGTSPLYTIRETFHATGGLAADERSVLAALSMIFWSLILIVTIKYILVMLHADNRGEGGILAIGSLALRGTRRTSRLRRMTLALAIFGLALFYADGLITPAISVLSAVEGLETATPELEPYVLPIAAVVLAGLFLLQGSGTARIGRLFGPVMVVWFAVLAVLGAAQIAENPAVLRALDPRHALDLFAVAGLRVLVALGAIVLAVTGAEAIYADMGHFGRTTIRIAWLGLVLPSLVLNYFGQGALILREPAALADPFYHLVPADLLYPLIGLATVATIIASQALISGLFSVTRQAIQLGYLPRLTIRHTSATERGQIYLPAVNWLLAAGVLAIALTFRSSSNLAGAYGITVTGTMGTSTILAGIVAVRLWRWRPATATLVFGGLFLIELTYIAANVLKIAHGGWLPLLIAAALSYTVVTWQRGRRILSQRLYADAMPIQSFIAHIDKSAARVPDTAVYMTGNGSVTPAALLHNLKHNKVLHERVLLMTVRTVDEPFVPDNRRLEVDRLGKGFFRVTASYGFMEEPDVPKALTRCREHGLAIDLDFVSFFIGRETLVPAKRPELGPIAEKIFVFLSTSAVSATAYFRIPPDRVVELGTQIEI